MATTLANCQIVTVYLDKDTGETTIAPPSGYTTPASSSPHGRCRASAAR